MQFWMWHAWTELTYRIVIRAADDKKLGNERAFACIVDCVRKPFGLLTIFVVLDVEIWLQFNIFEIWWVFNFYNLL